MACIGDGRCDGITYFVLGGNVSLAGDESNCYGTQLIQMGAHPRARISSISVHRRPVLLFRLEICWEVHVVQELMDECCIERLPIFKFD